MGCHSSGLTYNGTLIPHYPGLASDDLSDSLNQSTTIAAGGTADSQPKCTNTTRYWFVEGEGEKHMPKPRKGWTLEECQRMCQDDNCTAWQWWPVEGGCRWFTGKVSSEEKEGHPSVGGTMGCHSSGLTYNGTLIPHYPGLASDDLSDSLNQSTTIAAGSTADSQPKCTNTTRY